MEEENKIEENKNNLTQEEETLQDTPETANPEDAVTEDQEQETTTNSTEKSIEQLKKFTEEDEDLYSATKTLRSILGGDFLTANLVRKQILLVILIFISFFMHITYRYTNQKELVEIDKLKHKLEDARFNALTRFSEMTAKSRQSYIEDFLKRNNDSTLQTSTNPPFIIHLNGDEGVFVEPTADVNVNDTVKATAEEPTDEITDD